MMNAEANMAALRTSAATTVAMCRLRELSCDVVSACLLIAIQFSAANDVVKPSREAGRVNSRKNVRERSGRQLTRNVHVAAAFLDHQGLSPLCNLVQLFLAEKDLVVQARQVQLRTC